jgi:hypothetical protein
MNNMELFVRDIIQRFGGRYFGSPEEKNAQEYVKEVLAGFCDKTELTEFKSALESHFQSLKIFTVVYFLILVLIKFGYNEYAFILGVFNIVGFVSNFLTYRHWLDFLFPKVSSWNVTGDVEPLEEVKSTIIFSGHIDSVKEFKWWYKLKTLGIALTIISGFQFVLIGIYSGVVLFYPEFFLNNAFWWGFLITSPTLVAMFDMHGKDVVQGANDNLTGVAMSVEMAKYFSENRLKNTRVRAISFGSEEAGLRGAFAYAKENRDQLLKENALVVNMDSIKDVEHLTIITAEVNTLCLLRKDLVIQIEKSFKAKNVGVKKLPLGVGATDASALHMAGIPVISLIGLSSETLDETYHTRLDNVDNLNGDAMELLKNVLVHFVEEQNV